MLCLECLPYSLQFNFYPSFQLHIETDCCPKKLFLIAPVHISPFSEILSHVFFVQQTWQLALSIFLCMSNNYEWFMEGKGHTFILTDNKAPQILMILWFFEHTSCPSIHSSHASKNYLKNVNYITSPSPFTPPIPFQILYQLSLHLSVNPHSLPCLEGSTWSGS